MRRRRAWTTVFLKISFLVFSNYKALSMFNIFERIGGTRVEVKMTQVLILNRAMDAPGTTSVAAPPAGLGRKEKRRGRRAAHRARVKEEREVYKAMARILKELFLGTGVF
jgi:hypothetical protein